MCSYDLVDTTHLNKDTRKISRRQQLQTVQQHEHEEREHLLTASFNDTKPISHNVSGSEMGSKDVLESGIQIASKLWKLGGNAQTDEKENSLKFHVFNSDLNDNHTDSNNLSNWLQNERLRRDISFHHTDNTSLTSSQSDLEYSNNEYFVGSAKYIRLSNTVPWWQQSLPVKLKDHCKLFDLEKTIKSNILPESQDRILLLKGNSVFTEINHVLPLDNGHRICNIFWKSSLTFHSYNAGDKVIDFRALWPKEAELRTILQEAYYDPGLRHLLVDLTLLVLRCGPLRVIKVMVELQLVGVDHMFKDGQTLLHKACVAGNHQAVLYLTQHGSDTSIHDKSGRTADEICYSQHIMKLLGEVNDSNGLYGRTSMDTNIRSKVKVKMTPSLQDKQLMFDLAENSNDIDELLNKLQSFDFDVNSEADEKGDNLIHIATKQGVIQVALLSLLVKVCHADINLANREGYTCIMMAAIMGNVTIVDTLLCVFGADPDIRHPLTGRTALHYASQRNDLEVVSVLVKRGADYNIEDNDGARPDELAVIFRASDCHKAINTHRTQRMKHLVSLVEKDLLKKEDIRHMDLYLIDEEGYTLLMVAARLNCRDTLRWLVTQPGIPLDAQHEQTLKTALAFAAMWGHIEAILLLIRSGASPAIPDMNKYLPLHNATVHHQVAAVTELLQHSQAHLGLYKALELSKHPVIQKEIKAAMQRRQKNIVLPALFDCCVSGNANKLYSLLEEGDNVNQASGVGDWPMYLAVENGHLEVVQLLYQWVGDVDRFHPQSGNSVLHGACSRGHIEVTKYILDKCKNCQANRRNKEYKMINSLNYKKETPLIIAADKGYSKLVELLLRYGASSSVLSPCTGKLYDCATYEGLQHTLEKHRSAHTAVIMTALSEWKPLRRIQDVFLPQFDHNLRNSVGDTPLMVACRFGKTSVVNFLLESAVFEVMPSPPSNIDLMLLDSDSDHDSGAVLDGNKQTSSPGNSQHSKGPENTNNAQLHSYNAEERLEDNGVVHREGLETEFIAAVPSGDITHSASFYLPPNSEEEEEYAIRDNISTLLDSIASVSRGSVFTSPKHVNHLCAASYSDGGTVYHRTIQGGDNVTILKALLNVDQSAVNIQNNLGLSPLHLACKLGRKKIIEKFLSVPFVDLNCRTLDGKLPEEMSTNKSCVSLVENARKHQPTKSSFSAFCSIPSSIFGGSSLCNSDDDERSIDFDLLTTRFMLLKTDLGGDMSMFF